MEKLLKEFHKIHKGKRDLIICVGVFMGLIVAFEAYSFFRSTEFSMDEPRSLVAIRELPGGKKISLVDFTMLPVSKLREPVLGKIVTDQELHGILGGVLKQTLEKGKPLLEDMIRLDSRKRFSDFIPKGYRAYFVAVKNIEHVRRNERVDIFLVSFAKQDGTIELLEDVLVLDVQMDSGVSGATIAVTKNDIELLEKALEQGTLRIALKNRDEKRSSKRKKHWFPKTRKRERRIDVITEDV